MKIQLIVFAAYVALTIADARSHESKEDSNENDTKETNSSNLASIRRPKFSSQKARKFMVTFKPPIKHQHNFTKDNKTKKPLMPKIKLKDTLNSEKTKSFSAITRRPLMKTLKFTTKPRNIETGVLSDRYNINKRRYSNIPNQFKMRTTTEKNNDSLEDRFKNFTNMDLDDSTEGDSSEPSEENANLSNNNARRARIVSDKDHMSVAESKKVKSILHPISVNVSKSTINVTEENNKKVSENENITYNKTTRESIGNKTNFDVKLKDSFNVISKKINGSLNLELDGTTHKNTDYSSEEKEDRKEFIFIEENEKKNNKKTILLVPAIDEDDNFMTTENHILETKSRSKRKVNVIEEEHVMTTSSVYKYTGRELSLESSYNNIHT